MSESSFTVPSILSCVVATSAILTIARTSYLMGSSSEARGSDAYQSAFWGGSLGLCSLSMAFAIVKLLDEK
jgi:hypothetical protein